MVSGSQPYAEEEWVELRSQGHTFKVPLVVAVTVGVCSDQPWLVQQILLCVSSSLDRSRSPVLKVVHVDIRKQII